MIPTTGFIALKIPISPGLGCGCLSVLGPCQPDVALLPSGPCLTVLAVLVRFHGSSSVLAAAFYIVICGDKLVNY